jgi:hypothetical protein
MGWDIHATPAYGRDYTSAAAALADWNAGKDFRDARTGQYLSIRDDVPCSVWLRFNKLREIVQAK